MVVLLMMGVICLCIRCSIWWLFFLKCLGVRLVVMLWICSCCFGGFLMCRCS